MGAKVYKNIFPHGFFEKFKGRSPSIKCNFEIQETETLIFKGKFNFKSDAIVEVIEAIEEK